MDLNKQAHRTLWICVVLAVATMAAFWPVIGCDFTNYDDPTYVSQNLHVIAGVHWKTLGWAFQPGYAGNWHPVTWLSHMLDCQIFGLRASGHHLTNLLFHITNSLLVFGLFRQLTKALWPGAFVAALFALHPLHVESVAWVAERKDVLSTFFFLLTLMTYAEYARRSCRGSSWEAGSSAVGMPRSKCTLWYLLALLLFALGLMSKPMLVTVPFVLLLLDFWPLGRFTFHSPQPTVRSPQSTVHSPQPAATLTARRSTFHVALRLVLEKVPFFALAATSCVVTLLVQRHAGAAASLDALPLELRICNALISYERYICKTVWPSQLAVFYPLPPEWPAEWVGVAALGLAGVSALALRLARREPWFAFGWFWYLGTLVPVIGIIQVGQQAMADRYSYIPLIGLFVVIAWTAARVCGRWPEGRVWLSAGAVTALTVCGWLTWQQTGHWRDSTSLFKHALAVTRDNFVAHNNLGVLLLDSGDLSEAESHFMAAVRAKRNYPDALGNLGSCRQQQGQLAEARELFERSLKLRPTASVHYNLANLLLQQGELDQAQAHYEVALQLKPALVEAWYNLGALEAKRGRIPDAERDYRAALGINPAHVESNVSLGALLAEDGKFDDATTYFRAALRAAPDNANAHFNLASALRAKGDYAGAAIEFAEVCRLQPEDVEARRNLGVALLCQGKSAEAARQFREVLLAAPAAPGHYFLALALDKQGEAEEALAHYREAARLSPGTAVYLNDLAWTLATNPKSELRNGTEAVRLAERACELSGGKEARFWGTLDAAYAEAGRFADAQAAAVKARELALAAGDQRVADAAAARSELYRTGRPYHTP